MPRRRVGALLPLFCLAAACGGASSNGISKLTPTQVLAKVKTATTAVTSVHAAGSATEAGKSVHIDVHVGRTAAVGSLSIDGGTIELRKVNGTTYVRGDTKGYSAFGISAAQAATISGKWLKGDASSSFASDFASFLDVTQLFGQLLAPSGTVTKGSTATIHGTKALALVDSGSGGGTLYVAETGKPLPLRITQNASSGSIDFTDYGAKVTTTAPSGAIDLSQAGG